MTDQKTYQSASEIEREIEQERSALSDTLDTLRHQFSPEHMVQSASEQLRTHGSDMAQSVTRAVKENPMALAVTGIGLAWLIAGSSSRGRSRAPTPHHTAPTRTVEPFGAGHDPHFEPYAAGARDRFSTGDDSDSAWSRLREQGQEAGDKARDLAAEAQDSLRSRSAQARARVQQTGRHAYRRASEMLDRIHDGTAEMSESARNRVYSARLRAIRAQRQVEEELSRRGAQAREFARDEPLLTGALALAVGAAIGAALPRTRVENEAIGHHRDRLMDEADRVFREEAEKLRHVAEAAVAEGQDTARDALSAVKDKVPHGEEAVEKAEDSAQSGGQRIADAARKEAERQKLGDINH